MKDMCFSAVISVRGWNQWVQWVAPFERAHSFMAAATMSAMAESSFCPPSMEAMSASKICWGSLSFIARLSKTYIPKISRALSNSTSVQLLPAVPAK
jgi:hypothetical protein